MFPAVRLACPLFTTVNTGLGLSTVVSSSVLLPVVGSLIPGGTVTLAVLTRLPVADAAMFPAMFSVADCPAVSVRPVQIPFALVKVPELAV